MFRGLQYERRFVAIVYRPVFTGSQEVPSPSGNGEKVADRPDEGVLRWFCFYQILTAR